MKVLVTIIAVILGLAIGFTLSGLIFWGIGAFIIWAFGISFTWTLFKVTIKKD